MPLSFSFLFKHDIWFSLQYEVDICLHSTNNFNRRGIRCRIFANGDIYHMFSGWDICEGIWSNLTSIRIIKEDSQLQLVLMSL